MKKTLAALATVGLLLAGCSTPSADAGAAVQLLVFGSPDELDAYRSLTKAYRDKTGA